MKSVQIRSFFWSVYSCIRTESGDLLGKPPYLSRIQENRTQKKPFIWTLRIVFCSFYSILGDARWTFGKNWKTFKGTSHWTKHFNRYDQITKLCGNWAFPKTFYTRKLGEISIFYTMTVTIVAYTLGQDPFVLMWSTKRGPLYMVCRNFEYFFLFRSFISLYMWKNKV